MNATRPLISPAFPDVYPECFRDDVFDAFMTDPVLTPSGHIFQRSEIEKWIDTNPINPYTNESLTKASLTVVRKLQVEAQDYLEKWRRVNLVLGAEQRAATSSSDQEAIEPEIAAELELPLMPEPQLPLLIIKSVDVIEQQDWCQQQQRLWDQASYALGNPAPAEDQALASLNREFCAAVVGERSDISVIRLLMIKGAVPKSSRLTHAIRKNDLALAQLLLSRGVELKVRLDDYIAALKSCSGDTSTIGWLFSLCDFNNDESYQSTFSLTVSFGSIGTLEKLFSYYQGVSNIEFLMPYLDEALENKKIDVLPFLLSKIDFTSELGCADVIWHKVLCGADNIALVECLLECNVLISDWLSLLTYVVQFAPVEKPQLIDKILMRRMVGSAAIEAPPELSKAVLDRWGVATLTKLVRAKLTMPENIYEQLVGRYSNEMKKITQKREQLVVENRPVSYEGDASLVWARAAMCAVAFLIGVAAMAEPFVYPINDDSSLPFLRGIFHLYLFCFGVLGAAASVLIVANDFYGPNSFRQISARNQELALVVEQQQLVLERQEIALSNDISSVIVDLVLLGCKPSTTVLQAAEDAQLPPELLAQLRVASGQIVETLSYSSSSSGVYPDTMFGTLSDDEYGDVEMGFVSSSVEAPLLSGNGH
jgi:hypothetical protein